MEIRHDPTTGRDRFYDPATGQYYDHERCVCGHIAERHARPLVAPGQVAIGSGPCQVPGCSCTQFRHAGYTNQADT